MQPTSSVTFTIPNFTDADGIKYTDIELIIMGGDIRETANLAKTLERPLKESTNE